VDLLIKAKKSDTFLCVLCTKCIKWMYNGEVVSACFISKTTSLIKIKFVTGICIKSCHVNFMLVPISPIQSLLYTMLKSNFKDFFQKCLTVQAIVTLYTIYSSLKSTTFI